MELDEFAQLDKQRKERIGIAEAVYAPGKTPQQCADIVSALLADLDGSPGPVLLSRPDETQAAAVLEACPGGEIRERLIFWNPIPPFAAEPVSEAHVNSNSHNGQSSQPSSQRYLSKVVIATAGTGDLPPAKECQAVLEAYGIEAEVICDVGVAGIHRTLGAAHKFNEASVVVVVAGMEGALASVVGGMTPAPVIAVPSSVGYGSSLEGITALLAMLSSCAPGVAVVGIDNGFGAACAVLRMLQMKSHAAIPEITPAQPSAPYPIAAASIATSVPQPASSAT